MTKSSIDLSYLKSISMGSNDFELKMLKIFIEQTTIEMKKIRESLQREDWDALCASAHKIKPSFHFIGRLDTETLLNSMENSSRYKNKAKKLSEMSNWFLKSCKQIIKEVKIEIDKYQAKAK